jgi:hypothetical protein
MTSTPASHLGDTLRPDVEVFREEDLEREDFLHDRDAREYTFAMGVHAAAHEIEHATHELTSLVVVVLDFRDVRSIVSQQNVRDGVCTGHDNGFESLCGKGDGGANPPRAPV